ncbi:MAG: hypothetical protein AAF404_12780 [Pseudomonadota bacterium]
MVGSGGRVRRERVSVRGASGLVNGREGRWRVGWLDASRVRSGVSCRRCGRAAGSRCCVGVSTAGLRAGFAAALAGASATWGAGPLVIDLLAVDFSAD